MELLGSTNRQAKTEALQMLVRSKITDKSLLQPLLGLLEEPIEVSFLASRLVREMARRGLVPLSALPTIARATLGAGRLVTRELSGVPCAVLCFCNEDKSLLAGLMGAT